MPRVAHPSFAPDCHIEVDGRRVPARAGESVATAMIAAGLLVVARSVKYHRPRGAFCLAGSCHGCLARVDGVPDQRTCVERCWPGLVVETQRGFPSASRDVLGAIDHLFPHGLDHHHLATWSVLANRVMVSLSRRMAGAAALPDAAPAAWRPTALERHDFVIAGAGPAGLGAAAALARLGRRPLLADAGPALGGRLRCGLDGAGEPAPAWAGDVARAVAAAGGEVAAGARVLGAWEDTGGPLVLLGDDVARRMRCVRATTLVLATGTHALPPTFPRNDLPGLFDGRGLARALREEGLLAGDRLVVAGEGTGPERLGAALVAAGAEVERVAEVREAIGRRRVTAVRTAAARVRCDALAWFGPRAPASELARQAGAAVEADVSGGWRVLRDRRGATSVPWLWACGDVCGEARSTADAADDGRRVGEAAGAH